MRIYGDAISGNCLKVKWTADYLGLDYDWVEVKVLDGEARSAEFLKLNPAGQVPAVVLPDGRVLSQSNATIFYLATEHKSALIPEDTFDLGVMLQWMFWEQYSHEPAIAVRRFQKFFLKKADDEIDPSLLEKGNAALLLMNDELSERDYFAANSFSLADIALVAYTRFAADGGFDLSPYQNVRNWILRVEAELNLKSV